jgi:hydrogenase expression/formation protein HypE
VVVCAAEDAEPALAALRAHPLGGEAALIGKAVEDPQRFVCMKTGFGGQRIVDWLMGEQLPRIC